MTDDIQIEDVRPSLLQFVIKMERRLQEKDWKGGWEDQSRKELFDQLIAETMSSHLSQGICRLFSINASL